MKNGDFFRQKEREARRFPLFLISVFSQKSLKKEVWVFLADWSVEIAVLIAFIRNAFQFFSLFIFDSRNVDV